MMGKDPPVKVAALDVDKVEDGVITEIGGVTGELLDVLAQYLNFEYEAVLPPDRGWGSIMPNGTWNGMIGMVNRSEVEFSLGPFSLNPDRNGAVDFTRPIVYDNEVIVTPRPKLQSDVTGFLKPFTYEVWLLILGCLLVVSLALTCIEILEGKLFKFMTSGIPMKAIMWTVKTFTQEGSVWLPQKDGGRLIVMTWLLSSLIIMTSYSGILVAMLTLPHVSIPIDSLSDLVGQNDIPWKLISNNAFTQILKESKDKTRHEAYTRSSGFISTCHANRADLAEGDYAAICPAIRAKSILLWDYSVTGKCRLYIAHESVYFNDMMSFAFRRGSKYYKKSNKIFGALIESGILEQMWNRYYPTPTRCMRSPSHDTSGEISPLGINIFGGPFILLAGGLLISLLVFIVEIICRR